MLKKVLATMTAALLAASAMSFAASAAEVDEQSVGAVISENEVGAEVSDVQTGAETDSNSTGAGNVVYFNTTGWKNFNTVYMHMWVRGGDSFFGWKSKAETMTKVKDNLYSYDLSKLNSSTLVEGGFKSGTDYCICFVNNIDVQTYDMTFGSACFGDTAKMTGKMIETPKDSNRSGYETVWTKNKSAFGPHKAITSIGNIVGKNLCPNENAEEVIGDWLPAYYTNSAYMDPQKCLNSAIKSFNVKDVNNVYQYIKQKNGNKYEESEYKEMKDMLEKAYEAVWNLPKPKIGDNSKTKYVPKKNGNTASVQNTPSGGGLTDTAGDSTGTNMSNASPDGQETTIFIVLGSVMLAAAGVMFVSRRRREE